MAYGVSPIVIPPPKLILNPAVMPIVHRYADPPPSIGNRQSAIINRLCPPPTPLRFGDYRGHFCFLIAVDGLWRIAYRYTTFEVDPPPRRDAHRPPVR